MDLSEILFPNYLSQVKRISSNSSKFVHYTSAEVAVSILKNKQVWMRNATVMNDYKEIEYGIECVEEAIKSPFGNRFKAALDSINNGMHDVILNFYYNVLNTIQKETYILCISEHLKEEDVTGRLSMWRAYGGANGIAIVLNSKPFLQSSDGLKAYTSPVAYFTVPEFIAEFGKVVVNIESNLGVLKASLQETVPMIYRMLLFAILCTKHPGFREEREWRVVRNPVLGNTNNLSQDVEVVRGVPQIVTKLNLKNIPAQNLHYMEIPELVESVIIGPSNHPYEASQAIVKLLDKAGHKNALKAVVSSDIPLRQI